MSIRIGLTALAAGMLAVAPAAVAQQSLDEPTIQKKLESKGYSDIEITRAFRVEAKDPNGKDVTLSVNGETGDVRQQQSASASSSGTNIDDLGSSSSDKSNNKSSSSSSSSSKKSSD